MTYSLPSDDKPSLPQQVVTRVRGRAFLFKSLDGDLTVTFSEPINPGTIPGTTPGETLAVVWEVTPVRAGDWRLTYQVDAGLYGNAKAQTSDGSVPTGSFAVRLPSTVNWVLLTFA